jgi:hypothetical protein
VTAQITHHAYISHQKEKTTHLQGENKEEKNWPTTSFDFNALLPKTSTRKIFLQKTTTQPNE